MYTILLIKLSLEFYAHIDKTSFSNRRFELPAHWCVLPVHWSVSVLTHWTIGATDLAWNATFQKHRTTPPLTTLRTPDNMLKTLFLSIRQQRWRVLKPTIPRLVSIVSNTVSVFISRTHCDDTIWRQSDFLPLFRYVIRSSSTRWLVDIGDSRK